MSICKWLFEMGAQTDVSEPNKWGETPMLMACEQACKHGDLSLCKWLFENGAAADISTAPPYDLSSSYVAGYTPMDIACASEHKHQLSVCQWLFEVGAGADIRRRTFLTNGTE